MYRFVVNDRPKINCMLFFLAAQANIHQSTNYSFKNVNQTAQSEPYRKSFQGCKLVNSFWAQHQSDWNRPQGRITNHRPGQQKRIKAWFCLICSSVAAWLQCTCWPQPITMSGKSWGWCWWCRGTECQTTDTQHQALETHYNKRVTDHSVWR